MENMHKGNNLEEEIKKSKDIDIYKVFVATKKAE